MMLFGYVMCRNTTLAFTARKLCLFDGFDACSIRVASAFYGVQETRYRTSMKHLLSSIRLFGMVVRLGLSCIFTANE